MLATAASVVRDRPKETALGTERQTGRRGAAHTPQGSWAPEDTGVQRTSTIHAIWIGEISKPNVRTRFSKNVVSEWRRLLFHLEPAPKDRDFRPSNSHF